MHVSFVSFVEDEPPFSYQLRMKFPVTENEERGQLQNHPLENEAHKHRSGRGVPASVLTTNGGDPLRSQLRISREGEDVFFSVGLLLSSPFLPPPS